MIRLAAMLALLLGLCGCVGAELQESQERDRAELRSELATRAKTPLLTNPEPNFAAEAPEVSSQVRELLSGELDESSAIQVALLQNAEAQELYARLAIGRAELVQAGLLRNPSLTGRLFFSVDGRGGAGTVLVSLFDILTRPLRQRLAAESFEAERARGLRRFIAIVSEVRRRFKVLLAEQQLQLLHRRRHESAVAAVTLAMQLREAGNIRADELLSLKLEQSRAAEELALAELRESEAREAFFLQLGLWRRGREWRTQAELDFSGLQLRGDEAASVEERAVAASLDLAIAQREINRRAEALQLSEWSAVIPGLSAGYAAERDTEGGPFENGPAFSLDLPIFDRGEARKAIAAAELERALARQRHRAVQVRASARLLSKRCEALVDRALYLREVHAPLHDQYVVEQLRLYNAMQSGAFLVIEARKMELSSAIRQITALRDAWIARIDLDELLSGCLSGPRALPVEGALQPWPSPEPD